MNTSKTISRLGLAALLAAGACSLPAVAQTSAPEVMAAPAPAAQVKPSRALPRKRQGAATLGCEPVKDPWENICTIRKHAETACSDLPAPAARPARKARKDAPPPVAERNPRQECIDAYMRNV
jgi:hypothetical protein